VAKIFDLHSFRKGRRGKPSSKSDPHFPESGGTARGRVQSIDLGRGFSGDAWPLEPSSRFSLKAWAALLVAVGVLCGLYLGSSGRKRGNPKPDAQVQAGAAQPALPARALQKPSPMVPMARARGESGTVAGQGSGAALNPALGVASVTAAGAAAGAAHYIPVRYEATHKKVFGGCTGELELTSARLLFSCPKAELNLPVSSIARAHKDGIELKSGEKYHFAIANRTKEQVEAIFLSWVSTVQPLPQARRETTAER